MFLARHLDRSIGERVRVRGWHHPGGDTIDGAGVHHEFEVAWVEKGAVRYRVGRRSFEVGESMAIVLPAQLEHHTYIAPGTRAGSLWIDRGMAQGVAAALGRPTSDPVVVPRADRARALGAVLHEEAASEGEGQLLAVEAIVEAVLVTLLRATPHESRRTPTDPRIAAAVERIRAEHASSLAVDDLARTASMSRYHFSRLFREQTSMSPYQYLTQVRLERAAELLRSDRTVTAAAIDAGFRDLGRFARAFRDRYGVSPSEYPEPRAARSAHGSARTA
ncbi:MAG: helix-turn-helix transcriptional regulator [Sandaracinaceae bacterium]